MSQMCIRDSDTTVLNILECVRKSAKMSKHERSLFPIAIIVRRHDAVCRTSWQTSVCPTRIFAHSSSLSVSYTHLDVYKRQVPALNISPTKNCDAHPCGCDGFCLGRMLPQPRGTGNAGDAIR